MQENRKSRWYQTLTTLFGCGMPDNRGESSATLSENLLGGSAGSSCGMRVAKQDAVAGLLGMFSVTGCSWSLVSAVEDGGSGGTRHCCAELRKITKY